MSKINASETLKLDRLKSDLILMERFLEELSPATLEDLDKMFKLETKLIESIDLIEDDIRILETKIIKSI